MAPTRRQTVAEIEPSQTYRLALFVAGDEPNSEQARQNLARVCEGVPQRRCEVRIVDVLEDHQVALEHNILVTPSLLLLAPAPRVLMVGTLSNAERVRLALRIDGEQGMSTSDVRQLRARLAEAEAVIAALRSGEVDAVVGDHQVALLRLRGAERTLRESESRFRRLVDSNIIGVLIAVPDRIVEANDKFLQMIGYSREELESGGIDWRKMTPPEHQSKGEQGLREMMDRGSCQPFEKEYLRKDGSRVPILIGASLLTREPPRWLCFVLDLTELKRAERSLRELNKTLEQRVAERTATLKLLRDVATRANQAETIEEALEYTLRRVSEHNGWSFAHAYLPDEDDPDVLVPVRTFYEAAPGRFRRFQAATLRTRLRRGAGLPGRALATGEAQWADDVGAELVERRADVGSELGLRCGAAFPIVVGSDVVGVLEFFSDKAIEPTQPRLESMASIGTQVGRVIERQRFEKELSRALLSQQRRAGADLHDAVGQEMAGLALMADRMVRRLQNGKPLEAAALHELSAGLRRALEGTQAAVRGLLPPVAHGEVFDAALHELLTSVGERYSVDWVLECPASIAITDPDRAVHLYRIAAEAITNAARHAQARQIIVRLTTGDATLRLEVHDDGIGIPEVLGGRGAGLRLMRHRAKAIGATLDIHRREGGGTVVTCTWPKGRDGETERAEEPGGAPRDIVWSPLRDSPPAGGPEGPEEA
jgi:PAS domain S-box-containing protein